MVVYIILPATQEAEVGGSLELGRQKLQWAKIMPLHSSLDDSEPWSQNKIKKDYYVLMYFILAFCKILEIIWKVF